MFVLFPLQTGNGELLLDPLLRTQLEKACFLQLLHVGGLCSWCSPTDSLHLTRPWKLSEQQLSCPPRCLAWTGIIRCTHISHVHVYKCMYTSAEIQVVNWLPKTTDRLSPTALDELCLSPVQFLLRSYLDMCSVSLKHSLESILIHSNIRGVKMPPRGR